MSLRVVLYICSLISFVYGAGELLILNSPDSLRWKGNPSLDESMLREVYSAAMGYTIEKNSNWNGMYIQDPFNYPEALVHVAIEGVTNLGKYSPLDVPKYPLNTDEDEFSTWRAMKRRVVERHPEDNNTLVRVELSGGLQELNKYPGILKDLSIELNYPSSEELQVDIEENRKFFEEVAVMNAISEKIKLMKDNLQDANQDIYWFVFTSLHAVSDFHGPDSRATSQAREILIDSLQKLTHNMNQAYNGRVLVTAVTSDASHTRRARALLAEENSTVSGASATTESIKPTVPTVNINPQDIVPLELNNPIDTEQSNIITTESQEKSYPIEVSETHTNIIETTIPVIKISTENHIEYNETPESIPINTIPSLDVKVEHFHMGSIDDIDNIESFLRPIKIGKNLNDEDGNDDDSDDYHWLRATETKVQEKRAVDVSKWNLAADYNENYPVIFNIILWFGVAFFFSLLAVCYVIATMDPGRDSIIYRMTSNRMKKDN